MNSIERGFSLEIKDVWYRYPGADDEVIKGVSTTVGQGELIALTGAGRAGKSTLARLMAGVLLPFSGQILVNGLDNTDEENREKTRPHVGIVFQNPDNQLVAARVEEDVAFGPENLNLPSCEVQRRVDEAIEEVGINHLRERPPHLLSGGERQLLAITGSIAMRPSCLILDEPTAMLDPLNQHNILKVLERLARKGTTIIIITSAWNELIQFDRLWICRDGKLIFDDTPSKQPGNLKTIRGLGTNTGGTAELAFALQEQGVDLPPEAVTMNEMVKYLCRALR